MRRPAAARGVGRRSPPHPACGGVRLAARPPTSRRRQRFAARRHRPPPVRSPVRSARLAALRRPGSPECRAPSGPRGRCPGASPTPPSRAAADPPESRVAAASPAILCDISFHFLST
ncbi:serine/arginine-rich splicing factor SR45-like [Dermochelys coriacea]|uniref:serine/arginine-rich splicing factor SR45-like n=1 Tax=Dermochelys coriacea TaxID=27794 RepID=UPI001CA9C8D3|nr:serine/arginine-rich splicing factor SR45-like [Dermochelys coriacea]